MAQQLFDGEAEALARKVIELAFAGDPTALKLCVERIVAPRRDRVVEVALPSLRNAADLARVMGAVTGAVGEGQITPAEAQALAQTVDTAMRAIETHDFERRLKRIEEDSAKAEAASPIGIPPTPRCLRTTAGRLAIDRSPAVSAGRQRAARGMRAGLAAGAPRC